MFVARDELRLMRFSVRAERPPCVVEEMLGPVPMRKVEAPPEGGGVGSQIERKDDGHSDAVVLE